jgi:hypothetical protein
MYREEESLCGSENRKQWLIRNNQRGIVDKWYGATLLESNRYLFDFSKNKLHKILIGVCGLKGKQRQDDLL